MEKAALQEGSQLRRCGVNYDVTPIYPSVLWFHLIRVFSFSRFIVHVIHLCKVSCVRPRALETHSQYLTILPRMNNVLFTHSTNCHSIHRVLLKVSGKLLFLVFIVKNCRSYPNPKTNHRFDKTDWADFFDNDYEYEGTVDMKLFMPGIIEELLLTYLKMKNVRSVMLRNAKIDWMVIQPLVMVKNREIVARRFQYQCFRKSQSFKTLPENLKLAFGVRPEHNHFMKVMKAHNQWAENKKSLVHQHKSSKLKNY